MDGDACHTEWRETVVDDMVMEKFVLVPEVCPVGSMTSAAAPTFLPALSEVHSPVVLAGGGGVAAAYPLAMVVSGTARVSVLPVVGNGLPAVFVGKVTLDVVGLRVGPSCLRMDSEETLPALLDERSMMSFIDLGVTLDVGPMEGASVLEPFEHSVLEMPLDGGPMEEMSTLEPLEHSVLERALDGGLMNDWSVLEPLEHSVPQVNLVWGDCSLIEMTVSYPL